MMIEKSQLVRGSYDAQLAKAQELVSVEIKWMFG